jgi:hypothetical protein
MNSNSSPLRSVAPSRHPPELPDIDGLEEPRELIHRAIAALEEISDGIRRPPERFANLNRMPFVYIISDVASTPTYLNMRS